MNVLEQGYQNEYAGTKHNLDLISLPEYQEGIKQAKVYQQKQRANYTELNRPLVQKYNYSDPIKLIKECILSHIKNSTSLVEGITIIKSKKTSVGTCRRNRPFYIRNYCIR